MTLILLVIFTTTIHYYNFVLDRANTYKTKCKICWGFYVQNHIDHTRSDNKEKRESSYLFSVFPRLIVTRKLKIIVRSKESLNHSFLFDLNWCQIKRKREKRKRGWLYWPKSLKDKFFSCFHLYPYIILYVSMLLLGLFPFFFLYSSLWWQRSRWWSCWRWWI